MKKILFLIITFTIAVSSYGQNNCVNDVNTNPNHQPTQNHLDVLPENSGNPDERFLNKWKWWIDPLNPNVDFLLKKLKFTS